MKIKIQDTKVLNFLNNSALFHSTEEINTVNSNEKIDGDFTAKVKIIKKNGKEIGNIGVGIISEQLPDSKSLLKTNQWIGMMNSSSKQWLLTDNKVIAENGYWSKNKNASFNEGDTVTLFRKGNFIGFRINDQPNDYKFNFEGECYIAVTMKTKDDIAEGVFFEKKGLEFPEEEEKSKSTVNSKLKTIRDKYNKKIEDSRKTRNGDDKAIMDSLYKEVMASIFGNNGTNGASDNPSYLNEDKFINSKQQLQSPNKKYTVIIKNGDIQLIENIDSPNQKIMWKADTEGKALGKFQDLGLLKDGTLYLKDENGNFIWTNSSRKPLMGFYNPFKMQVTDNGNFEVVDKNKKVLWSTNSSVIQATNIIGQELRKTVPLLDGKCISSKNVKYRLCNTNGSFQIFDSSNIIKWEKLMTKDKKDSELVLNNECSILIRYKDPSGKKGIYIDIWKVETNSENCYLYVSDSGHIEVKPHPHAEEKDLLWTSNPLVKIEKNGDNNSNKKEQENAQNLKNDKNNNNQLSKDNSSNPQQNPSENLNDSKNTNPNQNTNNQQPLQNTNNQQPLQNQQQQPLQNQQQQPLQNQQQIGQNQNPNSNLNQNNIQSQMNLNQQPKQQ